MKEKSEPTRVVHIRLALQKRLKKRAYDMGMTLQDFVEKTMKEALKKK